MKSGIYGLFSLDGAPIDPADAAALGLSGADAVMAAGAVALGVDLAQPTATHVDSLDGDVCILQGWLDEPQQLCAELSLRREASPASLARAALDRFGKDAPIRLLGEWSCMRWRAAQRELTLVVSAGCRDPLFYSVVKGKVAIAPDIWRLARLAWVDGALDQEALLFRLGRYRVRRGMGERTLLRGARAIENASTVTIGLERRAAAAVDPFLPVDRWRGSFAEAMEEAEALLRRIVRQRLERLEKSVFLISGGLDSSVLSWLGSAERRPDQGLQLLTSAAPPDSGLSDETAFAQVVADHLHLPMQRIVPPPLADAYRPSLRQLEGANGPVFSARHYLYEALYESAQAFGASAIFDGAYGELSLTAHSPAPQSGVRKLLGRLRDLLRTPEDQAWPRGAFHVRLADHLYAAPPEAAATAWRQPFSPQSSRRTGEDWGYLPGAEKSLPLATEVWNGSVRLEFVFRDLRLLRLFASLPAPFLQHEGVSRAPARAILKGNLPDSIRLRPKGSAFSPDYAERLQAHAGAAIARIPAYHASGVAQWLDLEWLSGALQRFAEEPPRDGAHAVEVQLTAMVAEFLSWRSASR